jgi:N-acetylglucosaminyldiphosphoundecaprenol N-acetyl-beta-D-mannosaminyltransferase
VDILGCRLDLIDTGEACARILALAREDRSAQIVTLGTEMVVYAQRDEAFRAIVNGSAMSLCDTVGLLAVARRRGATLRERVTGVDLVEQLCRRAAPERLPMYFLGGAAGVAADAAGILEVRYPGLIVAGTHHGYFSADQTATVADAIRASGARLLFAGLGSPRQEYWLADHLHATGCRVGIGVGGSFDVISGRIDRAPALMRRFGLEWLYRLMKEPHRWRRQLALLEFLWLVALESIGVRFKRATT